MTGCIDKPWFGIWLTLITWVAALAFCRRFKFPGANPVLITVIFLIALLRVSHIRYEDYNQGGRFISFLLGPSVVAFAVPLYRQRQRIVHQLLPILLGVGTACITGIITAAGTALLLGADNTVVLSTAPKSVTAPIAIAIVEKIGGIPSLTAGLAVATGILGGALGPEILRLVGIRNRMAAGLAMGAASHGIGTARVREEDKAYGDDVGEAFSVIGMTLNGVVTAVVLPVLVRLFRLLSA